jgi:hypothetical protein
VPGIDEYGVSAVSLPPTELLGRLKRIHEIFATVLENRSVYDKLSDEKKTQLSTGINKSYGQAEAFLVEYITVLRAENKGRPVVTQTYGDVTSGAADALYAKTVEGKSVTAPKRGDVVAQIRKAIEQLAGNTGHMPRDGDVRVMDVFINSRDNPWPATGGGYTQYREVIVESELLRLALEDFRNLLSEGTDGAGKLRTWLMTDPVGGSAPSQPLRNFTTPTGPNTPPITYPGSTRPVVPVQTGPNNFTLHKARCVALKIRYDPGYMTLVTMQRMEEVTEISMQAFRSGMGGIEYKVVKVKKNVYTDVFTQGAMNRTSVRDFK